MGNIVDIGYDYGAYNKIINVPIKYTNVKDIVSTFRLNLGWFLTILISLFIVINWIHTLIYRGFSIVTCTTYAVTIYVNYLIIQYIINKLDRSVLTMKYRYIDPDSPHHNEIRSINLDIYTILRYIQGRVSIYNDPDVKNAFTLIYFMNTFSFDIDYFVEHVL